MKLRGSCLIAAWVSMARNLIPELRRLWRSAGVISEPSPDEAARVALTDPATDPLPDAIAALPEPSKPQLSVPPSAVGTSRVTHMCGFLHSTSVTTPSTETNTSTSNIARE